MTNSLNAIEHLTKTAKNRIEFWTGFLQHQRVTSVLELGVFKGDYAKSILEGCPELTAYYMIDPWRHLEGWDKPANLSDDCFSEYFEEMITKTRFAEQKINVLKGTTLEMIDQVKNESLDFAYLDGDHTLRGITVDLNNIYPKIKVGGWIGGDDCVPHIWQHNIDYEPSFVFPYIQYFSEAYGCHLYLLPHHQFLLKKSTEYEFKVYNFSGMDFPPNVKSNLKPSKLLKLLVKKYIPVWT